MIMTNLYFGLIKTEKLLNINNINMIFFTKKKDIKKKVKENYNKSYKLKLEDLVFEDLLSDMILDECLKMRYKYPYK
jgi:hypothetical protein